MEFYGLGSTHISVDREIVTVTFQGVFNQEGAERYTQNLKSIVLARNLTTWAFIGDVNEIQPSMFSAIQIIQKLVTWMTENGCICFINVARNLHPLTHYQLEKSKNGVYMLMADSLSEATKMAHDALRNRQLA